MINFICKIEGKEVKYSKKYFKLKFKFMNQNENQETSAPKPLTGNKQNIRYQIKSWQIALMGTIAQVFLVIFLMRQIIYNLFTGEASSLGGALVFVFISIYSIVGVISILLLYFSKTQKIGAIISIILGFASMLFFESKSVDGILVLGIQGIFVTFAGIYSFWKKL
jgi:hypothetical protein